MVSSCSAFGCTNEWTPRGNLKFHKFPIKNPERLQLWKKAIQRKDFNPTPNSVICSDHFKEEDYLESSLNKNLLKRDAVPSVFKYPINANQLLDNNHKERKGVTPKEICVAEEVRTQRETGEVHRPVYDVATQATLKNPLELKPHKELNNVNSKVKKVNRKNKQLRSMKVLIKHPSTSKRCKTNSVSTDTTN